MAIIKKIFGTVCFALASFLFANTYPVAVAKVKKVKNRRFKNDNFNEKPIANNIANEITPNPISNSIWLNLFLSVFLLPFFFLWRKVFFFQLEVLALTKALMELWLLGISAFDAAPLIKFIGTNIISNTQNVFIIIIF
jgi:hypothetical protein